MRSFAIFFLLISLISACYLTSNAQTFEKKWAVGTGVNLIDYQGPQTGDYLQSGNYDPGFYLAVNRYLSGAFNFSADFTFAQNVRHPGFFALNERPRLLDMSYLMIFKFNNGAILKERSFFAPYLVFGIGGNHVRSTPDVYVPLGGGVQFRVNDKFALRAQAVTKRSLNKADQHLAQAIAFVYNLNAEEQDRLQPDEMDELDEADLMATLAPDDIDADGVIDQYDVCPTQKGYAVHQGCPTDRDLNLALMQDFSFESEVPVMVADNSGVENQVKIDIQEVPTAPAPQKPIEFADASTDEPASASPGQKMVTSSPEPHKLKVLPQVKATYQEKTLESEAPTPVKVTKAPAQKIICTNLVSDHKDLQPIYFQSNSDILTQEAKDRLDKVASMLHECDQAQLVVQGHADALGGLRDNLVLSVMRAYNVKYYLVYERGVSQSRITSGGLGEGKPIADNQSSSGRQLNRRVDFSFVF